MLSCGSCAAGHMRWRRHCQSLRMQAEELRPNDCGVIADGCGGTLDCGSCGPRDAGAPVGQREP
jgi:hypothetical protein